MSVLANECKVRWMDSIRKVRELGTGLLRKDGKNRWHLR